MSTAVLGGSVTVPTLTGEAVLKVDPGTQPGERRVMRGKGIRDVARPASQGAQYVTFSVQIPSQLTARQRQLMQQFADDRGEQAADEQQRSSSSSSRSASRGGGGGSASSSSSSSSSGFFSGLFGGKGDKAGGSDEQQQPSGSGRSSGRDGEQAAEGERKRKQTAGNKGD
jgi:molecular chaperone DnaJ